jgi:hypothetical protein
MSMITSSPALGGWVFGFQLPGLNQSLVPAPPVQIFGAAEAAA